MADSLIAMREYSKNIVARHFPCGASLRRTNEHYVVRTKMRDAAAECPAAARQPAGASIPQSCRINTRVMPREYTRTTRDGQSSSGSCARCRLSASRVTCLHNARSDPRPPQFCASIFQTRGQVTPK